MQFSVLQSLVVNARFESLGSHFLGMFLGRRSLWKPGFSLL